MSSENYKVVSVQKIESLRDEMVSGSARFHQYFKDGEDEAIRQSNLEVSKALSYFAKRLDNLMENP